MDARRRYFLEDGDVILPPVASFTTNPTPATGAIPLTVAFTDTSTNNPTSWLWQITGGTVNVDYVFTVGSATSQNPTIRFDTAAEYEVTLTATNSAGSDASDPETITAEYNPGATAWWLASYGITLNGSNVASQLDKSGNGYTASQATSTKQPAFTASGVNSLNSITYAAAASPGGDYLSANALSTLFTGDDKPFSFSVLIYITDLNPIRTILSFGNSANITSYIQLRVEVGGTLTVAKRVGSTTKTNTGATVLAINTPYVVSVVSDAITVSTWINGVLDVNGGDINTNTLVLDLFSIGAFVGNADSVQFEGQIPELMVYNSAVSDALREANEEYLRAKYNAY